MEDDIVTLETVQQATCRPRLKDCLHIYWLIVFRLGMPAVWEKFRALPECAPGGGRPLE